MSGEDFIMCGPPPAILGGSASGNCAHCDAAVVISPTGQRMMRDRDLVILCIECVIKEKPALGDFEPLTAEQVAEIQAATS